MDNGAVTLVVGIDGLTTGAHRCLIFQKFIREDALELATGKLFVALETVAESSGQWVTFNLPELSHLNLGGVEFEGGTHRRKETPPSPLPEGSAGSHEDESGLVFQRVDGVDDVVVFF